MPRNRTVPRQARNLAPQLGVSDEKVRDIVKNLGIYQPSQELEGMIRVVGTITEGMVSAEELELVIDDVEDLEVRTENNTQSIADLTLATDNFINLITSSNGSNNVGYKLPSPNSLSTNISSRLNELPYQPISSFGATPVLNTGTPVDSSDALQKLINDAFARRSRMSVMNGTPSRGNIVIDLGGREYYISKTLTYPPDGGYVTISNGIISADDSFPIGDYLFNKATGNFTNDGIGFDRVVFNGRGRAQGLRFAAAIRCFVDRCLFTGNYGIGLHLDAYTIELMTSRTFLFQTFSGPATVTGTTGIKIENQSTDNHFTDVVERGNLIGVDSYSQANTFKSVHVYGHDMRSDPEKWGMCFRNNTANNRLNDCQFDDGCRLLIENPSRIQVRGCSFASLQGDPVNCIVIKAVTANHFMSGVIITGNVFNVPSGSDTIIVDPDSLSFSPADLKKTIISDNVGSSGVIIKGTRFRKTVTVTNVSTSNVDVSNELLVGNLTYVRVSARNTSGASPLANVTATGGTGYTNGTFPLVFSGGGGTGASGFIIVSGGVVGTPIITSFGQGYRTTPTVTATGLTGGTGNTFAATLGTATIIGANPWVTVTNSATKNITWRNETQLNGQLYLEVDTAVWD